MNSICSEAIGSCNESIETIRAAQRDHADTQLQYISILKFCNCNTEYIFENLPIDQARMITDNDYRPCCGTPLYDAMGTSLNKLYDQIKDKPDATVAVTIITDGYENSSKEFDIKVIKALVNKLKAEGWLFAYIGADHDVESVALSINIEHTFQFDKSTIGVNEMSEKMSSSRTNWYNNLDSIHNETKEMSSEQRKQRYSTMNEENDFFADDDDKKIIEIILV